jgi:hypothetical protein
MITLSAARARARKRVDRYLRDWAAFGGADAEFTVPLNPPTERTVLADTGAAIAWSREWRDVDGVEWATRQWPSVGAQRVPERVVLRGADAIAAFAGRAEARDWRALHGRAARLRDAFLDRAVDDEHGAALSLALAGAIRTHWRPILGLDEADFVRLVDVVLWFVAYPASGWRIRQLPIRGIDTKWLARHRAVVTGLHLAVTERASLGLTASPNLVRVRILDPRMRPGGLCDIAAPAEELAVLDIRPEKVFVFENLESVLAMPDLSDAVVIHGGGYGVDDRLRRIPWVVDGRVSYWGDLDSHGFAILNQLRSVCPDAESVLMDEATLLAFRDLWVPEPDPATGTFGLLTDAEQLTLDRVRAEGNVRMEQERITWRYAMAELLRAGALEQQPG